MTNVALFFVSFLVAFLTVVALMAGAIHMVIGGLAIGLGILSFAFRKDYKDACTQLEILRKL